MSTAARIRQLRVEKAVLTQRQLAQKIDVEPMTVSRWERGETTPSDLNRVLLARVFGIHPNDLLADDEAAA